MVPHTSRVLTPLAPWSAISLPPKLPYKQFVDNKLVCNRRRFSVPLREHARRYCCLVLKCENSSIINNTICTKRVAVLRPAPPVSQGKTRRTKVMIDLRTDIYDTGYDMISYEINRDIDRSMGCSAVQCSAGPVRRSESHVRSDPIMLYVVPSASYRHTLFKRTVLRSSITRTFLPFATLRASHFTRV